MAARSKNRRFQSRVNATTVRFETLEPRNMLAADWGIANPYSSSLVTHFQNDVSVDQQMSVLLSHVKATPADSFELIKHELDSLGFEHFKYQHHQNGIPVESSTYTVHAKEGLIVSLSGEFHQVSDDVVQPSLTETAALDKALGHAGAKVYPWQDQAFIDTYAAHQDEAHSISTDKPEGELVYSQGQLAWKFDVYAVEPMSRAWIFVDATDGTIVDSHNQIQHFDVPGTGPTLYDANVTFTADFTGSEYRLREVGNATEPAVETYTLNNATNTAFAVDFTSTTANFGDPGHDLGNQTHWGTEQTWAYFYNEHGRDSYDDAGSTLRSYVSFSTNYVNAFWNGSHMTYGDGNGVNRGPLVSLDIVGHELGHGVTQFSAGLVYVNNSGALNESFSDIFGESIENYARGSNDWLMGGDIGLNGNAGQFRNMANPNQFNHADTYLGDYWYAGNGDQGGVHLNSGVQNKWYYIMVNGEAGTNDTGHTYNVTGIGYQDAASIAYRNLTQYLTANATYPDARAGAVRAAIDLFGVGSQQHISTMEAWDAVGVYDPVEELDLFPLNPRGSQLFAASAVNTVAYESDTVDFDLALDANQLLTLTVLNQSGSLLPSVTITDAIGNVVASQTAALTTDVIHFDSIYFPNSEILTISVGGDVATTGSFEASLLLNGGMEAETLGFGTNDILADAEDLESTSLTQGHIPNSLVDRLAVLGELGDAVGTGGTGGGEDFESGTLDPDVWETFSSTPNGRIVVADDTGTPNGTYALSMDVDTAGIFNLNEAIMTLDLTDVTDMDLSFSHISFGDETNVLPGSFGGSFVGDGVSISEDGLVWHTVWSQATFSGVWEDIVVDLDQEVDDAGIAFGPEFKIKFQQYDNFPRSSDGRAFDGISAGTTFTEDWYSLTVDPGESITVVGTQVGEDLGALAVEIYDAAELLLASSVSALNTFDAYIETFVGAGAVAETYYIRVSGSTPMYTLLVTRGGAFDLEDGFNQDITGLQGVLGYVSGTVAIGAEPDDAADGDNVSVAFAGVTLSNEVTGGAIFATEFNGFEAPTGTRVFAPAAGAQAGFREGNNEFRADFDDLQSFVSIEVGSDDTLDVAFLRAYDSSGVLLQQIVGAGAAINESETLVIQRPTADIAYVISAGVGSHTAPLDNLVFEAAVIDSDTYITTATTGDEIEFRTYIPADGPFEFENRLAQPGGKTIEMILVDPTGTTVATGSHVVSHQAEMDGDYELIVYAPVFDGEYYVTRDTGIISAKFFGGKFLDGIRTGPYSDLIDSDDVYMHVDPSPTTNPYKQKIDMILVGDSGVRTPASVGFRLEASMTGGPAGEVMQSIRLYNHVLDIFEVIDTRAVDNTEIRIDIDAPGDPTRFVHPTTGEFQVRIEYVSSGFTGPTFFWSIDIDQAVMRLGQY